MKRSCVAIRHRSGLRRALHAMAALVLTVTSSVVADAPALAQESAAAPAYRNTALTPEQRARDLIARMTLEEKALQLGHAAPAIPRLGVPEYNWWNEGLHGVARAGVATVYPQAIGMAASWNAPLLEQVGDAVSTIPAFSLNQYGLYGDLANDLVHAVAHHPASLSFVEAAAVWMQYLTAYGALIDIGKLAKGDTALIPAASSSVGLAAIQIANRVGAVPVALTRGSSKRQALADAGAAHVIATDEQDLVKEVLQITGGKGARVVFDHTLVPDELRGRGIAAKLACAALTEARQQRWRIVPRCSYVAAFIKRHPEFANLVDRESRP